MPTSTDSPVLLTKADEGDLMDLSVEEAAAERKREEEEERAREAAEERAREAARLQAAEELRRCGKRKKSSETAKRALEKKPVHVLMPQGGGAAAH